MSIINRIIRFFSGEKFSFPKKKEKYPEEAIKSVLNDALRLLRRKHACELQKERISQQPPEELAKETQKHWEELQKRFDNTF